MDNDVPLDLNYPFLHTAKLPSQDHKLDLIFVHGLNSSGKKTHPYDDWTHANGSFWPKDFLANDIPNARIQVYGYNANVQNNPSLMSEAIIKDHANNLLNQIKLDRDLDRISDKIKIIFISHSLGGLIVKQALLNAFENPMYTSIYEATYGLVFFACPHQGANGTSLASLMGTIVKAFSGGTVNNQILTDLSKNSIVTEEMTERFRHQLGRYQVVSFIEQKPLQIGAGQMMIVDRKSALLGLAGDRETQVFLTDADHSSICKIAGKDNMYRVVAGNIRLLTGKALASAPGELNTDTHATQISHSTPGPVQPADNSQPEAEPSNLATHSPVHSTSPPVGTEDHKAPFSPPSSTPNPQQPSLSAPATAYPYYRPASTGTPIATPQPYGTGSIASYLSGQTSPPPSVPPPSGYNAYQYQSGGNLYSTGQNFHPTSPPPMGNTYTATANTGPTNQPPMGAPYSGAYNQGSYSPSPSSVYSIPQNHYPSNTPTPYYNWNPAPNPGFPVNAFANLNLGGESQSYYGDNTYNGGNAYMNPPTMSPPPMSPPTMSPPTMSPPTMSPPTMNPNAQSPPQYMPPQFMNSTFMPPGYGLPMFSPPTELFSPLSTDPYDVNLAKLKNGMKWVEAKQLVYDQFQKLQSTLGPSHENTLHVAIELCNLNSKLIIIEEAFSWLKFIWSAKGAATFDPNLEVTYSRILQDQGEFSAALERLTIISTQTSDPEVLKDIEHAKHGILRDRGVKKKEYVQLAKSFYEHKKTQLGENHIGVLYAQLDWIGCTLDLEPYDNYWSHALPDISPDPRPGIEKKQKAIIEAYGKQHPAVIRCNLVLAEWLGNTEHDHQGALDILLPTLPDAEASLGVDHPTTLEVVRLMGISYELAYDQFKDNGHYHNEAEKLLLRYVTWVESRQGDYSTGVKKALGLLVKATEQTRNYKVAKPALERIAKAWRGIDDERAKNATDRAKQLEYAVKYQLEREAKDEV